MADKKKIVISGGTGFIGTNLTKALQSQGFYVTILTRNPDKYRDNGTADSYAQHSTDPESLKNILEGSFGVINLTGAGVVDKRWSDERKKVLWDSRIETTDAIAQAIKSCDHPPKKLLSASGVGYYGPTGDTQVDEDYIAGDDFLAKLCIAWEDSANEAISGSTSVNVMRTGLVLDKDEGALAKIAIPFKFKTGGHLGDGNQYYPWIHIDDVVGIYLHYLGLDNNKAVNVSAPNPERMKDFCKKLADILGGASWAHVPGFVIKLILGEAAVTVLKGQKAIPKQAVSDGYQFQYSELKEALINIYNK